MMMVKARRKLGNLEDIQRDLVRKGEFINEDTVETKSEGKLGKALLDAGVRLYPQHQVGKYHFDFKIKNYPLLIEVDGLVHSVNKERRVKDYRKDRYALRRGFRVIRVANGEIGHDLDWVIKEIKQTLSAFKKVPREVMIVELTFWQYIKRAMGFNVK